eukprot:gene17734-23326_t
MSKLQRNITGAEWDHVGVIVNLTLNSYRAFIHNKNKKPKSGPKTKLQVLHRSYYDDGIQPEQTILCIVECTGEGVTCHPLHSRMKAYDFYQICEYIAVRRLNVEDHISRQTPNLPKVGLLALRRLSFFLTYVIELVAAFLKTLGVIKTDCPKEENFWPGSFAVNALIDKHIVDPMFYGGTIIIDPEVNGIDRLIRANVAAVAASRAAADISSR